LFNNSYFQNTRPAYLPRYIDTVYKGVYRSLEGFIGQMDVYNSTTPI